jgi:hypothetical protein
VQNRNLKDQSNNMKFKPSFKLIRFLLFTVLLAVLCLPTMLMAQVTNAVPGVTDPATPAITSPWVGLIPLAVPVVLMLLKMFIPNLPSFLLPILAPLLGAGADIALHYAGVSTMGAVWGAMLGSAGVGLRELGDQLRQRVIGPVMSPP